MDILNENEVADLLKVKAATLRTWRFQKMGPPYLKIEGAIRYDRSSVEAWAASKMVEATK